MAVHREIIYLGRDNPIELILKADETAQDLSGVTHMEVVFSGVTVSSVTSTTYFDWQDRGGTSGTTTGWVKLMFGAMSTVTPGSYDAELIVYDSTYDDGLLWGKIPVKVSG